MRNHRPSFLAASFILAMLPATYAADTSPREKVYVNMENLARLSAADQDRVLCIAERLETIANTDRSTLTREERKALRAETRELKQQADLFNRDGTVIYFSAGTLIIILLLILILT